MCGQIAVRVDVDVFVCLLMCVVVFAIGKPGGKLKLGAVMIKPNPPVKGEPLSVSANASLSMYRVPCFLYYLATQHAATD